MVKKWINNFRMYYILGKLKFYLFKSKRIVFLIKVISACQNSIVKRYNPKSIIVIITYKMLMMMKEACSKSYLSTNNRMNRTIALLQVLNA
jgi:hypothetical protein